MSSRWLRLLALAVVALGAPACVGNEISFFIEANQVPIAGGIGGMCMVTADPMALRRSEGTLDLTVRDNYILYPLWRNEMLAYAQRNVGHPETRGLFVDGADIEIHRDTADGPLLNVNGSNGVMVPATFRVSTNAYIDPATSAGPGYSVGTMEIIPGVVGEAMANSFCQPIAGTSTNMCPVPQWPVFSRVYVVVVKPFGHTMGENFVSGSVFNYPVTVCCHCLVEFMAGVNDPTNPSPNCSGNNTGSIIPPCTLGQDDPVDCRLCSGTDIAACQPRGFQPNLPAGMTPTCPVP